MVQIRIGDGAFGGEQCLGDVHSDVFHRFHTCAQQVEDAQSGAHMFVIVKKCTLQASVSPQKTTASSVCTTKSLLTSKAAHQAIAALIQVCNLQSATSQSSGTLSQTVLVCVCNCATAGVARFECQRVPKIWRRSTSTSCKAVERLLMPQIYSEFLQLLQNSGYLP